MKSNIFLAGVLAILMGVSFVSAQTVTGDNFVLKGSNGNMTAQLTTSGEGTPALFFYDSRNVVRISIGLYADGVPGVVLNDDTGKAGAIMRLVTNKGEPVVVLKENGIDKVIIDKNGMPSSKSTSTIFLVCMALLAGFAGGYGGSKIAQKKEVVASI
jgi:hypothetical protein